MIYLAVIALCIGAFGALGRDMQAVDQFPFSVHFMSIYRTLISPTAPPDSGLAATAAESRRG
jgi:hypothetical protein